MLKPGVIGHIRWCAAASEWCQVQEGEDYRGYLKRGQFWDPMLGEAVPRPEALIYCLFIAVCHTPAKRETDQGAVVV